MFILREFIKTGLSWLFAILTIILLVWIPREVSFSVSEYDVHLFYGFSIERYIEQVLQYISMLMNFDLGTTKFDKSVAGEVSLYVSRSLIVIFIAFVISLLIGTAKGFFDYRTRHSRFRLLGPPTTFTLQSIPDFFFIIVFQMIMLWLIDRGFPHLSIFGYESWHNFVIAGSLLAIFPTMYMARIVCSALMTEEGHPYITTARSKGLSVFFVLWKHQFTSGLIHVVPHLAGIFIYVLSNLIIIEYLTYFRGAALRLYQALGFAESNITGRNRSPFNPEMYEPELVIAILAVFISLIAMIQLISKVFMHLSPLLKGGRHE
ncbi:ABC transporter permease subunit [Bacillus suaedae]|uniref:ABC transporter permease subunit n=1 Tax=Halalkalibacter suaedae TaxID=2822140 RepID=A0A940WUW1_9BACI|nr:ABC transporter permease subunit [Bacillus suaedae]MBP3953194.1 ABC transporter permease subunit [Bacillus suaedae]